MTISQIMTTLGDDLTPTIRLVLEDLLNAITTAESISMTVLVDTMKTAIENALIKLKAEVAELTFKHFSINDFEPTDEIIPLMREVVACHYGGVRID